MCSAPRMNVQPPAPVILPEAPKMETLVADQSLQAGPKTPKEAPTENPTLARRGKRGLVIPLRSAGA